jgi:Protein of unknown function (DUF3048) N-terminal domain/Protein of unknown function (DUF3048) C-terminal domain
MDSDFRPAKEPARSEPAEPDTNTDKKNIGPKQAGEVFRTPDEIAAEQALRDASAATKTTAATAGASRTHGSDWRQKLALHWPPGKKEWAVAGVVILLAAVGTFLVIHHPKKPVAVAAKPAIVKPVKPKTVPSTLSGLPVDPSINKRPVTGVMIENSTDARPQSGLGQGMVVFEAVAEGGVTRFLALYQDTSPDNVGPIRSARPYYIQWALGFDAGYAHVGGSPDGLADIKAWGVRDLDQFANAGSYHRVTSRAAPHNVYTSITALNQLETTKGYTASTFTGFIRKAKEAPSKTPTAKTIDLTLSGPVYNVHYDYNPAINTYNRNEGGAAQIDANTGIQINPKVVIAMVVPKSNGALDTSGAYYSNYAVIGSGPVYVFQDGTVTTGTWAKSNNTSQITFTDAAGKPIGLNPGQTWLTAVDTTAKVSYAP